MKKHVLLFVITLLNVLTAFNQVNQSSIKWFESYESSEKFYADKVVFYDSSFVYTTHKQYGLKEKTVLTKFNRKFQPVLTKVYNHKGGPGIVTNLRFITIDNKLYLYTSIDGEFYENQFFEEVNLNTLEVSNKKVLYDQKTKRDIKRPTANPYFANDQLKVLIHDPHNERNINLTAQKKFKYSSDIKTLRFINFETNEKWTTTISDTAFISDVIFGENSDVHILLRSGLWNKRQCKLLSILNNGQKKIYRNINLKAPIFNCGKMCMNSKGNLVVYGYTSTEMFKELDKEKKVVDSKHTKGYKLSGTVFFEFDPLSEKLISSTQSSFPEQFTQEVLTPYLDRKNTVLKGEKIHKYWYIFSTSLDSETSYVTINNTDKYQPLEDGYLLITGQKMSTMTSQGYIYNFRRKLVISKISQNGELLWSTYVPLYQGDNGSKKNKTMGYSFFSYQNKLHVLYNENVANRNIQGVQKAFGEETIGYTADYQINMSTGEKSKKEFITGYTNSYVLPQASGMFSSNEYLIQFSRDKKLQFGLIDLKSTF